jgi:dTDP-4-dehydrorhamnose 3,5-epimerase
MQITSTIIPDVLLISPRVFEDDRGFFMETYHQQKYHAAGITYDFVQDNHSRSQKGTLRGLHYQIKHPQGKLVRVVVGEVFDVAVDLRHSSPTFGKWTGHILSAATKQQLWIPPGLGHGFLALSDWAEVIYKASDIYSPEDERCVLWNDPEIGINWPIDASMTLQLSRKDQLGKHLHDAEVFD